jgi:hypothetical protein
LGDTSVTDSDKNEIFLRSKAEEEGLILYFNPAWFEHITISRELRNLPLVDLFDQLLPNLDLRIVRFPPNYVIVTKPLPDNIKIQEEITRITQHQVDYTFDPTQRYTITGIVRDNKNSEPLIGITLFVQELQTGTLTNEYGRYTLTLPSAYYHISITALGYEEDEFEIALQQDSIIDITLYDQSTQLQEIIVYDMAEDKNVSDISMGTTRINLQTLNKIPPMMGEVDVIRSIMLLPGVTSVGEGATGFNVRGGSVDQNQILLDEAPVFNPSHFFGFFTAFNAKAIKDLTISKGGIPAQYGGRISSILDIKLRQGNNNRIHGEGGIGLITSNLLIDGPIIKDKTTFLFSGRATYSDWLLRYIPDKQINNSSAYFHDFIGKVTHQINPRNNISISGYTSMDKFKFPGDSIYGWSNYSATLKWSTTLNHRLFNMNSFIFSNYDYTVWGTIPENAFKWMAGIQYYGLKSDYTFLPNLKNKMDAGIHLNFYGVKLGDLVPDGNESNVNMFRIDPERALESAIYLNHEYKFNPDLTLMGGVRYSHYILFGPGITYFYDPTELKSISTVTEQREYGPGEIIQQYGGFEPRISLRYGFDKNTSLKMSYNRMRQYIHLISNTSAVSPVDIWKLSDSHLKPQIGDQVALGLFKNFKSNTYETSVELYYKFIQNSLDYKNGAELVLNRNLERELVNGVIRAYGAEFLLRKNKGRLNGWIAYTLSRAERKVKNKIPEETINSGNYYPVNYDKLHDLAMVINYDFTRRHSFSLNYVFYSGRPISYPTGSFGYEAFLIANFEVRNQERIPAYHRLDLSFSIAGNHRKDKKWESSWTFSIYNLMGRKNPYSIFFKARGYKAAQAYRLSVIGAAIPSITYNFKF